MTVHETAHKLVSEAGHPLKPKEIAKLALENGLETSSAKDPILSIAGTIEKTIREEVYNSPRLVFVSTKQGRKIGLPSMEETEVIKTLSPPHKNVVATNGARRNSYAEPRDDQKWISDCRMLL